MSADLTAVRRVGPAPYNSGKINAAYRTPAAVAGDAQWTIPGTGVSSSGHTLPGCWVTITNEGLGTSDILRVSFWATREGSHVNVGASDIAIMPGATQEYECEPGVDSVKFGGPVTAVASHYRSSI